MGKYYDKLLRINEALDKELGMTKENVDPDSEIAKKLRKSGLQVSYNSKGLEVSYADKDEQESKDIFGRLCASAGVYDLVENVTTEKMLGGMYLTYGNISEELLTENENNGENTIEIPKDSLTPEQKKEILLDKGVDQKTIDNLKDDKEIDGALDATLNNDEVKQESGAVSLSDLDWDGPAILKYDNPNEPDYGGFYVSDEEWSSDIQKATEFDSKEAAQDKLDELVEKNKDMDGKYLYIWSAKAKETIESESVRDPLVDYLQEHANVRSERDCVDPEAAVEMVSDILKIGHPYHIKDKLGFTSHFMQYGKSKYRFVTVRRTDKNMVIYKDDEPGEFYALDSNLTNEEFFEQIAGFIRKLGADKGLCESKLDDSDVSEEVVIRMDDDDLDMHGFVKAYDGKDIELVDDESDAEVFQHEELGQNKIAAICNKFHYDPSTFKTVSLDPRADEPYEDDEENNDDFGENWVSLDPMHPGATTLP